MLQLFKKFISPHRHHTPEVIQTTVKEHAGDKFDTFLAEINAYFKNHPEERVKYAAELHYLNTQLTALPHAEKMIYAIIPYPFAQQYDYTKVPVYRDETSEMFYVYLDGKKLFYHKGYKKKEDVQRSFTYLSVEQDPESPHRYLDADFAISNEEVVADLGAAEGNFSLMIVDNAKALYIVEPDPAWIDALRKTFEPWKEKVHIINKFAGDHSDENTITLLELLEENKITAVKMDIEGAELDVLEKAGSFIRHKNLKFAITTYHRQSDANNLKRLLESLGYTTQFSDNHMLFIYDQLKPPYFRKGLIKAFRQL